MTATMEHCPSGGGADAAASAARAGSVEAVRAVRDGGRLATITADQPAAERDITMRAVQVALDGRRLGRLVQLLAHGLLTVSADDSFPLVAPTIAYCGSRDPRALWGRRPRCSLQGSARPDTPPGAT